MKTNWHTLEAVRQNEEGEIRATAKVAAASPWFSGHFPGDPILPGIAQIFLVAETVRQAVPECPWHRSGLRRVRFKRRIRPEELMTIEAKPFSGRDEGYSFRILVAGEVACSGTLTAPPSWGDR